MTLGRSFMAGSFDGQLNSVYKDRFTKPEKVIDYRAAIVAGTIGTPLKLTTRQATKLVELGVTVHPEQI